MKFFRQCRTEERQTTRLHNRTRSTMTEQGRGSSANFSPISIPSRIRDISLVRRHAGGLTRVTERGKRKREREKGITRKRISSEELSSREKSETTRAREGAFTSEVCGVTGARFATCVSYQLSVAAATDENPTVRQHCCTKGRSGSHPWHV